MRIVVSANAPEEVHDLVAAYRKRFGYSIMAFVLGQVVGLALAWFTELPYVVAVLIAGFSWLVTTAIGNRSAKKGLERALAGRQAVELTEREYQNWLALAEAEETAYKDRMSGFFASLANAKRDGHDANAVLHHMFNERT